MIRQAFILPLALLAVACATSGENRLGLDSSFEDQKELFLCPSEPAVCLWSLKSGWELLWKAEPDVYRERLSLWGSGRSFRVLWQRSPYGGTFLVFSREGQVVAAIHQGVPLGGPAAVGEKDSGSIVVCTGRDLETVVCSTWFHGEEALTEGVPPAYLTDCLFPRYLGGTSYCVEDTNPFRDPSVPLRLVIREMAHDGRFKEKNMSLPAGFLQDFMPLGDERALFAYEDGRVFEVRSWREVVGPIASGVQRLQRLRNRVYLVAGPALVEQGAIIEVEGQELKTLWTGREAPQEMTAPSDDTLLLRLEDPVDFKSKILLLTRTKEKTVSRILFQEKIP